MIAAAKRMAKKQPEKLSHRFFPSKLLLFGEHTINKGSMGIAIPSHRFEGFFKQDENLTGAKAASNQSLEVLCNYIIFHKKLSLNIDTDRLLMDVESGLYFDSTIPQGYGLGSSGALAAGILHNYASNKFNENNMAAAREILADIESYYHGKSSGLDALVSFLDAPVLITEKGIEKIELPKVKEPVLKWFLVDTGKARSTADYVNHFLKKHEDKQFAKDVSDSLVPAVNHCIDLLMQSKSEKLFKAFTILSQLQMNLMPEFIPQGLHSAWRDGLKTNNFLLKICGAGGGGFMLGICKADVDPSQFFSSHKVVEVMLS
jgi:mevalonate kinase